MKKATNVRLSEETWQALRELAHRRALERGERTNASAVIEDLVQREAARVAAARVSSTEADA
jgi:predicted transcriptional regulator